MVFFFQKFENGHFIHEKMTKKTISEILKKKSRFHPSPTILGDLRTVLFELSKPKK